MSPIKCEDCQYCLKLNNSAEAKHGICSYPETYFPVNLMDACIYYPKEYTCGDCERFGNDFACMTCKAEDPAYHSQGLCSGFIDKHEANVRQAIFDWYLRGHNIQEKLDTIMAEVEDLIDKLPKAEEKNDNA